MDPTTIGLISIGVLISLVLLGVHVGVALSAVSVVSLWIITGNSQVALSLLGSTLNYAIKDYVFAVIPLFILMGSLLTAADISDDLFRGLNVILRRVKGGLVYATIVGNAFFAAVTGSSIASAATFSKISLGPMYRLGYDKKIALGSVAGTSVLGMLIPPSTLFILYGILTDESIGKLFIAGIVPGILLTVMFAIGVYIWIRLRPGLVPDSDEGSYGPSRIKDIFILWPVILLIAIVLGGIYGGLFTPTEAGAVGAFGSLTIALTRRRLTPSKLWGALLDTGYTSGSIMILVICAQLYSRMLTLSGVINWLQGVLTNLSVAPMVIIGIFIGVALLMGTLIDGSSIMLLVIPIMYPIIKNLGFDPIWFAVVITVVIEMGLITPPFGMSVFTVKAVMGDVTTLEEIFSGSSPFLLMICVLVVLLLIFPGIVTWLPNMM